MDSLWQRYPSDWLSHPLSLSLFSSTHVQGRPIETTVAGQATWACSGTIFELAHQLPLRPTAGLTLKIHRQNNTVCWSVMFRFQRFQVDLSRIVNRWFVLNSQRKFGQVVCCFVRMRDFQVKWSSSSVANPTFLKRVASIQAVHQWLFLHEL